MKSHKPTQKKKRLTPIDIFRGVPLLIMIAFHLFNELWSGSIYSDKPYFTPVIDGGIFVHTIPALFAFISGISIYLLLGHLAKKNKNGFYGIFKRYGIYVLFSLPFTWFLFGITTFIQWDETIQGLGLTGIVFAGYWVLTRKWHWKWHSLSLLIALLANHFISPIINRVFFESFPRLPELSNVGVVLGSIVLNMFSRGFFSVLHLFAYMLAGALFIHLLTTYKGAIQKKLFVAGIVIVAASMLLHQFIPIAYYGKSMTYQLINIGEVVCIGTAMFWLFEQRKAAWLLNILYVFGRVTIFSYLGHFLIIIKPMQLLGLTGHVTQPIAWLITIPLLAIVYYGSKFYMRKRNIPLKAL